MIKLETSKCVDRLIIMRHEKAPTMTGSNRIACERPVDIWQRKINISCDCGRLCYHVCVCVFARNSILLTKSFARTQPDRCQSQYYAFTKITTRIRGENSLLSISPKRSERWQFYLFTFHSPHSPHIRNYLTIEILWKKTRFAQICESHRRRVQLNLPIRNTKNKSREKIRIEFVAINKSDDPRP